MKKKIILALLLLGSALAFESNATVTKNGKPNSLEDQKNKEDKTVKYRTLAVDGLEIFYREAGSATTPTILLLHGFPSSSHMYRDLIDDLAGSYHVVAPDYPGFGNSSFPSKDEFKYTFDNLSTVIEKFIDAKGLKKFTMYIHDYGSSIGFRIAARRPELIQALVIQNAIAHPDGIGPNLAAFPPFWANRNAETEKPLRGFLTIDGTKFQYLDGAENPKAINPDAYFIDQYFLNRSGNADAQLDLFFDYQNNVAQFAVWQNYLQKNQPPTLIAWGKNDKFFTVAGADAYKNQLKGAEIHLLNSGHFMLEEHHAQVAELIKSFLSKKGIK